MRFGHPPTHLRLEIELPPDQVEERLRSSMKIDRSLPATTLGVLFVAEVVGRRIGDRDEEHCVGI